MHEMTFWLEYEEQSKEHGSDTDAAPSKQSKKKGNRKTKSSTVFIHLSFYSQGFIVEFTKNKKPTIINRKQPEKADIFNTQGEPKHVGTIQ